ncbi:MAG: hypothetical protein AB1414_21550, partial [bacterium]
FIKKKLYKCVYAGDYQRFSTIIHKVLKNSFIKGKNYSLEPLMNDLFLLQTRQPWIVTELSNQLKDLSTRLDGRLDLQREIMKYQAKCKVISHR